MEDLVPLGVYQARPGFTWRTAVTMSVMWGSVMLAALFWFTRPAPLVAAVMTVALVIGSAMFGILWTRGMRREMGGMVARLHAGDPELVPAPPPGRFDARLLCTLVRRLAIGGHLYVGSDAWVFVPHRKNLAAHQAPVALGRPDELSVSVIQIRPNALVRLMVRGPIRRVRVAGPAGEHLLVVPDPEGVAERLRRFATMSRSRDQDLRPS